MRLGPLVLLVVPMVACVDAGTSLEWPGEATMLSALVLVEDGAPLQRSLGPRERLAGTSALPAGQSLYYATFPDDAWLAWPEIDLERIDEAETVLCDPSCVDSLRRPSDGIVEIPLEQLSPAVYVLESGATAFEPADLETNLLGCMRTPLSEKGCAPLELGAPRSISTGPFLPDGVVIGGHERRWSDGFDRDRFFDLTDGEILGDDGFVALSISMLYWGRRGQPFVDGPRTRAGISDQPDAAGADWRSLLRVPGRHADGSWRLLAGARGGSPRASRIHEMAVDESGIRWVRERFRIADGELKDIAWIPELGRFVIVGFGGLVATATAPGGQWEVMEGLDDRLNVVLATGSSDYPIAMGSADGRLLVGTTEPILRFEIFDAFTTADIESFAVRRSEDGTISVWAGASGGRVALATIFDGQLEFTRLSPLSLPREELGCGGALDACGARTQARSLKSLQWVEGSEGGYLLSALVGCPGLAISRTRDLCGRIEPLDLPLLDEDVGGRHVALDAGRAVLFANPGAVYELER